MMLNVQMKPGIHEIKSLEMHIDGIPKQEESRTKRIAELDVIDDIVAIKSGFGQQQTRAE